MKKVMRFLVACSMATFVMACSDDATEDPSTNPDNNGGNNGGDQTEQPALDNSPVELKSVVFYAADNSAYIDEDVAVESVVEEKDGDMVVRIKDGGAGKELKMTLTAGAKNIVKVDGKDVECAETEDGSVEGKVTFDATFPADITVSNEAGETKKYVVKVGKVLATTLQFAYSYNEPNCSISDVTMAVNPKDNKLYICYVRKTMESGDVNKLAVVKWNGTSFDAVGTLGFTSFDKAASAPSLAFDKDGVPYVAYLANSYVTVKRLGAGDWEVVGEEGVGTKTTSMGTPVIFFNPATNMPIVYYFNNAGKSAPNYREMMKLEWNGSSWVDSASNLAPAVDGSNNAYWGGYAVQSGDATYVITMFNLLGHYIQKYQGNTVTTIIDAVNRDYLLAEEGGLPYGACAKVFADAAGNIYVVGGANESDPSVWNMQVYKLDEEKKTLVTYGNVVPLGMANNISTAFTAGVNPLTGEVFGMYKDLESKLAMFSSISEDLVWNPFVAISTSEANAACIDFGADGVGYAMYYIKQVTEKVTKDDGTSETVEKVPATIELYRLAPEADVLPE